MEKQTLKRIFEFLEEKENKLPKAKGTLIWKMTFNEPLIEEELNVKGDLNLHNSKITSLPRGLKVGGYLNLFFKNITSLPEGLEVGGSLYLIGSKIKSLPKGLKVDGNLNLEHTNITSLPKGLEVGGLMRIGYTPLKKYTDEQIKEMVKPGFIKGKIVR